MWLSHEVNPNKTTEKNVAALLFVEQVLSLYSSGSQSGVRGPPGVLEGVPAGPQLNDS